VFRILSREAQFAWRSQTSRPKGASRSAEAEHLVEKPALARGFFMSNTDKKVKNRGKNEEKVNFNPKQNLQKNLQ
jgi:hypothetical protein